MTLDELVQRDLLERVPKDSQMAQHWLDEADRHLAAAVAVVAIDRSGAHSLAYDAARKAAAALVLAHGYRTRAVPGSHRALCAAIESLGRTEGESRIMRRLDRLRRDRNRSEYGSRRFGGYEVEAAIADARELVILLAGLVEDLD